MYGIRKGINWLTGEDAYYIVWARPGRRPDTEGWYVIAMRDREGFARALCYWLNRRP